MKVPSVHSGHSESAKQIASADLKSELEQELIKISEKEELNSIHYKIMANKNDALLRPVGGRNYMHIKSRFKDATSNSRQGPKSIANYRKFIKARRLRPSSACSSPTKLGNAYDDIDHSDFEQENSKFYRLLKILLN